MKKISLMLTLLVAGTGLLASCSQNISPNTYTTAEVGVVSHVVPATIIAIRLVEIENTSGAGGVAGTVAGAAAGSAIGGGARANIAGAVGGAVIGGMVGHAIDKSAHTSKGYEYILRTKEGKILSVVQSENLQLHLKQKVLIIYGAMTRIIPDDTSLAQDPKP